MSDLRQYLRACRDKPFRYGTHDCALFAARWVMLKTGRDLTLGIRYRTIKEGRDKLASLGFESQIDVAAHELPEIPPAMAQPGDIAVVDGALCIVIGERVAVLTRRGLGTRPLTDAVRAFRT